MRAGPLFALLVSLAGAPSCRDEEVPAPPPPVRATKAPGIEARHEVPEPWLARRVGEADRVLLDRAAIEALNARNASIPGAFVDVTAEGYGRPDRVAGELEERFVVLRERVADGRYVESAAGAFELACSLARASTPVDELRIVATEVDLRCVPMDAGLFTIPADPAFDRNQCSRIHPAEVVRVLRLSTDGAWRYVHAGHTVGWLHTGSADRPGAGADPLTPPLAAGEARAFRDADPRLVVVRDRVPVPGGPTLRFGASVPLLGRTSDGGFRIRVPVPTGLVEAAIPPSEAVHEGLLPFTRRNVVTHALAQLDAPYGWGGLGGGRDCSRLLLDLFALFGLRLGRNSAVQSQAGSETIELGGLDEAAKRSALRDAASRGVVLVYMPGHIMLYLGDEGGRDFAVSAIAEYLRPTDAGDQVVRLDRVVVSDLEPGRGTGRTAYLERLTRLARFGP